MGAITKANANSGCAYFRGRGLELKGFTIQVPYKEYLSSVKENIDTENGILAVYNYDLADRVYNEAKDTTAFQIFTKIGPNAANKTTSAKNMHALDVGIETDYAYSMSDASKRNARVRAARIQVWGKNNISGHIAGAYILAQCSGGFTYLGRYVENSSSYGAIGVEVRTETTGTGTVVIGDGTVIGTQYGMCNILLTYNGKNALTGNVHYIVMNIPYEGGAVSGETVGIKFVNQVVFTGTAFDMGIDFATSMVVKAINVDACSVFFDADVTVAIADNAAELIVTSSGVLASGTSRGLHIELVNSGAKTATGAIEGLSVIISASDTVEYAYGAHIHVHNTTNNFHGYLAGMQIDMDDPGTACEAFMILDLYRDNTNIGSIRDCYIRCKSGGSVAGTEVFLIEGQNQLMAKSLFGFVSCTGGGDNTFIKEGTTPSNPVRAIKCTIRVNPGDAGTPYYIPLYDTYT